MVSFAERLRELRVSKSIGQKEVGAVIGVSDSSIRKYESGDRTPNPEAIKKLATFFEVSTDYLLGDTTSSPAPENKKPKDLLKFLEQSEVMFDGETYNLDEEDKKKLRDALEYAFWHAKQKNKRKKE